MITVSMMGTTEVSASRVCACVINNEVGEFAAMSKIKRKVSILIGPNREMLLAEQ